MYVIRLSGGAGSAIAAHRTVGEFGARNCVLVFADTGSEDETTYDFIRYARDVALAGVEFHWLKDHDGDIWDFFDKHGFIRHPKTGCMASYWLKQVVLDAFSSLHYPDGVIVTGLDWMEQDRIERLNRKLTPRSTYYPLCYGKKLSRCQLVAECERLGYPRQALYERGYPHNNCGGGCVLAGISQWAGLYADNPERFIYNAMREKQWQELHDTDFTILKDRRGGVTRNLSLLQLKARIDSGDFDGLQEFRSTCSCMTDTAWESWEQGVLFT